MTQPHNDSGQQTSPKKPADHAPSPSQDANEERRKAEASEVAGRHKNDGQKDHKGAR